MILWIFIMYTGTKFWLVWSYGLEIEIAYSHRYINVIARVRYIDYRTIARIMSLICWQGLDFDKGEREIEIEETT